MRIHSRQCFKLTVNIQFFSLGTQIINFEKQEDFDDELKNKRMDFSETRKMSLQNFPYIRNI